MNSKDSRSAGTRRSRHNRVSARQRPDLTDVVSRGAGVRRHKFLVDLGSMLPTALLSGALQSGVYTAVLLHAGRSDWHNTAIICLLFIVGAVATAAITAALRTRDFPFTLSSMIGLIIFNFVVVLPSALRIPVSYTGFLMALPVALIMAIVAATRLRHIRGPVAILDFPDAENISATTGASIIRLDGASPVTIWAYDHLLVDAETHYLPEWQTYLVGAQLRGIEIEPWFSYLEKISHKVDPERFDLSHLTFTPSQVLYVRFRRAMDLLLLFLLCPLIAPLMLLVWGYIRAIDGSPSIFVQTRRGYLGKSFRMLKFRTMRRGTHGGSTAKDDRRIIPGCELIRKLRLDELPQVVNILRGEMSWIGPRPVSLEVARACEATEPTYTARYLVPPGITGWAQVKMGYAENLAAEMEKLGYDLYYLKRISLDLDLEITLRTVQTLLLRKGAQ